jgi:hypothetical protein
MLCSAVFCLVFVLQALYVVAQQDSAVASATHEPVRDDQHDFDFEIGTWKTHLKRLVRPLTGSTPWVECDDTTVVRKVWGGKTNFLELEADCRQGDFEGLNLRFYDPPSVSPMEPQFFERERRHAQSAHHRRVQKWTW